MQHFHLVPHHLRNWQREEPPNIPPQTFGLDGEFIAHGVEDDAQVLDDQIDESGFLLCYWHCMLKKLGHLPTIRRCRIWRNSSALLVEPLPA